MLKIAYRFYFSSFIVTHTVRFKILRLWLRMTVTDSAKNPVILSGAVAESKDLFFKILRFAQNDIPLGANVIYASIFCYSEGGTTEESYHK